MVLEEYFHKPKKLIACCDGTWMNSDNGYVHGGWFSKGHLQTPSNVTRISRAIEVEDSDHHSQIVFYQSGVGGGATAFERLVGGGTGEGIGEHMREAYSFLANNYIAGDSIFLLGFSRGAFTARSVGGLIGAIGLLDKAALRWFYLMFHDWENAGVKDYKPMILDAIPDFVLTAPPSDIENYLDSYKAELLRRRLTRDVEIEAIGVWDTVGALGIPTPTWIQSTGLPDFLGEYKFFDTSLDNHIRHAFHALALDEQRSPYGPTIWERKPGCTTVLKQCWFPGVHSNVGGSYDDTGIADISLAWMMSNLAPFIDFKPDYIREQCFLNKNYCEDQQLQWGWGLGRIYESCLFPQSVAGWAARRPRLYHRFDYFKQRETRSPLENTNETVHPSVRVRIRRGGKGYEGKGKYNPRSLKDWELVDVSGGDDETKKQFKWTYKGKSPRGAGKEMMEEPLGKFELELLRLDEVAAAEVLGV